MSRTKTNMMVLAASALAALLLGFTLLGCSGAAGYEGSWKATDVENPAKIHVDPSLSGSSLTFELKAGGGGSMTLNGASVDVTWSETSSGVKLDQGNGHTLDLKSGDGKLSMVDTNGNTIYFEKQ